MWHYFQVDNEFCIFDGRDITENAIFERFNSVLNILSIVNVISKGLYGSSSLASEMSDTEGQQ